MSTNVNLVNLELVLTRLAEECKTLGMPWNVHRLLDAAINVLPRIEVARRRARSADGL